LGLGLESPDIGPNRILGPKEIRFGQLSLSPKPKLFLFFIFLLFLSHPKTDFWHPSVLTILPLAALIFLSSSSFTRAAHVIIPSIVDFSTHFLFSSLPFLLSCRNFYSLLSSVFFLYSFFSGFFFF
jgi:hypothetical protein